MVKATTTIRQVLNYQDDHAAWFAANQSLFNLVAAFYFDVIQAHAGVLDLSNKEALKKGRGSQPAQLFSRSSRRWTS